MSSLTIDDIQVYITTYNRPELIGTILESVLCQSAGRPSVAVLDNGMFDSTGEVLAQYGVVRHDSRALGLRGNLRLAQQLLDRKYVLLLHDDDQIHSDYMQMVLNVINAHPAVNIISCRTMKWPISEERRSHEKLHNLGHIFSQGEFATFFYNAGHPSFSLSVYEAQSYKRVDIDATFDAYGKWGDWPFMIEVAGKGGAAVFLDTCGWMGIHPGQDTYDPATLPDSRVWINREKMFYTHMGDDPRRLGGLSFCLKNYRHLKSGYKRRIRKDISFAQYMKEAEYAGALTRRSLLFRFFSFGIVQKFFIQACHRYYDKTARPLF